VPERVHFGLYGEINANLIDGSSIWLQSMALTLAAIPGTRVTVLLRAPSQRDLVLEPLRRHPAIELVEPDAWSGAGLLDSAAAVEALVELDARDRFDFVILRGASVVDAAADSPLRDRLWIYYVPVPGADPPAVPMQSAHRILCQTEAIRSSIERQDSSLAAKTLILPPMIPAVVERRHPHDGPLRRLFYAGKISPEYCGLEMFELVARLRATIPDLTLHVAGDKIHNPADDPDFRPRALQLLETAPGVVWHGGVPRSRVNELMQDADVALSLRHRDLDDSQEMSTKVLEYGAAGCPVLLNRTDAHARMLGDDYPLFASDVDEAATVLLGADREPSLRALAATRTEAVAAAHTFARVAERIAPHLGDRASDARGEGRPHLLVAGHSFGFAEDLAERTRALGGAVRWDRWSGHMETREGTGGEDVEWADVVLCEWCLGNAVWHSRTKRDGRRLVVRFHRMELETEHPGEVELDRVDVLVFVADHVRQAACRKFGWDPDDPRMVVLPNAVDLDRLRLPKLPGAEFTLGLIGYVPWIKRLDRALEILELLRANDDRFRLIVKGRGPWEYAWMQSREEERRSYERVFARIRRSPLLRDSVVFESFGDDIETFLQQVGWVVSASEIEGHSVALAEGMASGAVPVILERPGADEQYETRWVHRGPEDAAAAIGGLRTGVGFAPESGAAAAYAERWGWERIGPEWDAVLAGSLR
jgi:glycosyltransferase involved in cell wall biosynthesis